MAGLLTDRQPGSIKIPIMSQESEKEDRLIRALLIGGASAAVLGLIATATLVAVMISYNFNILNWME
jgi:hypothetical protein